MRFSTKRFALVTAVALVAVLAADRVPAAAQDAPAPSPGEGRTGGARAGQEGRFARGRRFLRQRAMRTAWRAQQARRRHAVAEAMAFTQDQRRLALEKSRAAQPIVAEGRREIAKLLAQAESGGTAERTPENRAARKAALQDARKRSAEKLAPLAKDVLASLTPEQRAKLDGLAAAHGRKLDETKLVRRVGRWLARPMTADLLEAQLGTR